VAVWPPADVVDTLRALERPDVPRLRWTQPEQWHVTLRFLGSCEVEPVADALAATPLPAAGARLGPALIRLGRGVLAAPVGGLESVVGAVTAATSDLGRPPGRRPFRGHVTLARSRGTVPAALAAASVEGEWAVDAVCLVVSHLHPAGARYEVVRRFPVG
jgi:2'-5' RNA ligase